ncbi:hypothetical protein Zmor_018070 [Zophobas morio]|uniref:Peptidase C19 ubiquitin carboxyl-terminal hydrolase domain-containing protein n=2 Tax=Zophobas morio TaxID=2755281 RepID=A0AA38MDA2_9CUCU|nr:hypothetical protein Zmor_018070 [Zophobas morio]
MLNGGHYISYACNPNGNWYCYNDSSCREVLTDGGESTSKTKKSNTPLRKRKVMKSGDESSLFDEEDEEEDNKSSTDSYKCPYSDVKAPKIDTSSAYILFYERSGLDYKPYLPEVVSNGQIVPEVELDENESELRKQLCSIQ